MAQQIRAWVQYLREWVMTKETGFLAGDSADEIKISRLETRFLRKSYLSILTQGL